MKRFWTYYSLAIVLFLLFMLSWAAQLWTEWNEYVAQEREADEAVEVGEFLFTFGASTFENWQSEFLQLFTFVVLTKWLVAHGSKESKKVGSSPEDHE